MTAKRPVISRRSALTASAASLALLTSSKAANAQLEVDINQGQIEPLPTAVADFAANSPLGQDLAAQITTIIRNDLQRSGLFDIIDPNAYLQNSADMNPFPGFADWRLINAQALVSGQVTANAGQPLSVEFRLWDVFAENQLRAQRLQASAASLRRIAHKISDAVYERMTGQPGYFDTRIVFVSETGPATAKVKNLAVIDQDGANQRTITNGNNLILSPNVSRDGRNVAYIAYHRGGPPRIFVRDLVTGREELLFNQAEGMTFSPRYSPDDQQLLFSLASGGNTEIYAFDLQAQRSVRLSRHPAIDTSPSFAPDGQRIVFNSDRGGSPQLYLMNRDGSNVQRISYGAGRYGSPAWSPRGDFIAFTKIKESLFHIGVMRPDGSDERLITRSFLDEQPSWAPNGRTIVFTRQDPRTDKTSLYTIDWSGYNLRELKTNTDASDSDWAPLIP